MHIEVLCTGDELLTGVTADTNSPFFMERALRLGERVLRTTVVGDHLPTIAGVLREIAARSDVVLVSGGLGPTSDDLTVDAAALAAGVDVELHAPTLERLQRRFAARGLQFTENNARQARVPKGAEVIENAVGSAPMLVMQVGGCRAFFVPGVPREYKHLVEHEVVPRLRQMRMSQPGARAIAFRLLRSVGLPESHLDARIAPVRQKHTGVEFGFRTQAPENHLKLLAAAATQEEADALLAAAERDAREVVGDFIYGRDDETLPGVVLGSLKRRGETVAFAESCTGGLLAAQFTGVPGASEAFAGALVTYTEATKTRWADVPAELIAEEGVVSEAVAVRLAEGARVRADASWGIGITGWAGPGGGDDRNRVGAVFVAVAGPDGVACGRHDFGPDRERVRKFATWAAMDALRRRLAEQDARG